MTTPKKPGTRDTYGKGLGADGPRVSTVRHPKPAKPKSVSAQIPAPPTVEEQLEVFERPRKKETSMEALKPAKEAMMLYLAQTEPEAKERAWTKLQTEYQRILFPGKEAEDKLIGSLRKTAVELVRVYITKCEYLHIMRETIKRKAGEHVITKFRDDMAEFYGVKGDIIGEWCRNGGASDDWKGELITLAGEIGKKTFNSHKFFRQKWAHERLKRIVERQHQPGIEHGDPVALGLTTQTPIPVRTQADHKGEPGPEPSDAAKKGIALAIKRGLAKPTPEEETREQIAIANILDLLSGSQVGEDLEEAAADLETILTEHSRLLTENEELKALRVTLTPEQQGYLEENAPYPPKIRKQLERAGFIRPKKKKKS